tara:strand:+ start:389 stop:964 length:576 start_codon:yes stop_codon:yes gene_type:complete
MAHKWNDSFFGSRKTVEQGQFGEPKPNGPIKKEADKFDKELIQEHGFKYLLWDAKVQYELFEEPSNLEDWDFNDFAGRYGNSSSADLTGHYEIVTRKGQGIASGFSRFDYIHFFERKIKMMLTISEYVNSDNDGIEEVEVIIPEQIYYFNNYLAGEWQEGQVNPKEIKFEIDLKSLSYRFVNEIEWKTWSD